MDILADSRNGYVKLPAVLRSTKCMWLMFYLFFKIVIPFIFRFFN